jgi:hypothetical protein
MSVLYDTASFISTALPLTAQFLFSLALKKDPKNCLPEPNLGYFQDHFPFQTIKQLSSIDVWSKALEHVFVTKGSERQYGLNP